jgi:hypothetical protein
LDDAHKCCACYIHLIKSKYWITIEYIVV